MKYIKTFNEAIFNQEVVDLSLQRIDLEQSMKSTGDLYTLEYVYKMYIKTTKESKKLSLKDLALRLGFIESDFENKTDDEISKMSYQPSCDMNNSEHKKFFDLYDKISVICNYDDDLIDLYDEYAESLQNEDYIKCNIIKKKIDSHIQK